MNEFGNGLLILIKSAVDGTPGVLPEGFSLTAIEKTIQKHQVVGLAYEGAVLCGIDKEHPAMQRLFRKYYEQMLRSEKQIQALEKLFAAFDEKGIDYLPVKGWDMKMLYPNPAMRTMGDADVLIRIEQYDRICKVLRTLGYKEGKQTEYELIWDCPVLHLELHKQLMPSYHSGLQRKIKNDWDLAVPAAGNRYTYSPEDMYLFLFVHLVKHYTRGGVGLRHVLDLWFFAEANPTMDMVKIQQELSRMELAEFHNNIRALIRYWFAGGKSDHKVEFIAQFIISSGSWGKRENSLRFDAMRQKKIIAANRGSRVSWMFKQMFPGLRPMQQRFPVLRKCPWLLPVMWLVRGVKILLFGKDKISYKRKTLKYTISKDVQDYEAALHYVGLHYDI